MNRSNIFKGCPIQDVNASPEDIATLLKGDKSEEVRQLQLDLILWNYLYDVADGSYGKNTVKAVMQVQSDAGLPVTGIADPETQIALLSLIHDFEPLADDRLLLYSAEYDKEEGRMYIYYHIIGEAL